MRFFYWPNPKLEGPEDVGGQPCYKIRVNKPRGSAGRYEVVYVWVHTKFGAFRSNGHSIENRCRVSLGVKNNIPAFHAVVFGFENNQMRSAGGSACDFDRQS